MFFTIVSGFLKLVDFDQKDVRNWHKMLNLLKSGINLYSGWHFKNLSFPRFIWVKNSQLNSTQVWIKYHLQKPYTNILSFKIKHDVDLFSLIQSLLSNFIENPFANQTHSIQFILKSNKLKKKPKERCNKIKTKLQDSCSDENTPKT